LAADKHEGHGSEALSVAIGDNQWLVGCGRAVVEGVRMDTTGNRMKLADLTDKILGTFYDVYNELGCGFLESVYQNALAIALSESGLTVMQQKPIPVYFRGRTVGDFYCDLVVDGKVILELKAVREIAPEHIAQTINYLRATDVEVALLLNFGEKPAFRRLVFDNERKKGKPRIDTERHG
jgi:GxxExxY protein